MMAIFWTKLPQTVVRKMKIRLVDKYKSRQAETIGMGAIENLF